MKRQQAATVTTAARRDGEWVPLEQGELGHVEKRVMTRKVGEWCADRESRELTGVAQCHGANVSDRNAATAAERAQTPIAKPHGQPCEGLIFFSTYAQHK